MGNDDKFKVDLDQLDTAVTTIAGFNDEVADVLADIERRIAELHLSWSSDAASAQRAAHDKWMAGVDEMAENLDELREVARLAHTNYTTAIEHNTRMWPS